MRTAQELYEGVDVQGIGTTGLITYMRTDSLRISEEARAQAATAIEDIFGKEYLPTSRVITRPEPTRRTAMRLSALRPHR